MAAANARPVGRFVWNTTTGEWRWDAGMYEVHGYRDRAIAVSTALVLDHKQEEHRGHAASLMRASATRNGRFSNYHTIVDAHGRDRTVLVVGESRPAGSRSTPSPRVARGFMVDVTEDERDSIKRSITQARQSDGVIQQSLGLLMGSLGLTEDAALTVLRQLSQHHDVKVRDLAPRFMAAAVSSAADSPRDLLQVLIDQATSLTVERAAETDD